MRFTRTQATTFVIGVTAILVPLAFADVSGILLPTSDGYYLEWAPKTGTSHFAMVDESPCNGNTDYVSTTTVGQRDSYSVSLASVPNGATITKIDYHSLCFEEQQWRQQLCAQCLYALQWDGQREPG